MSGIESTTSTEVTATETEVDTNTTATEPKPQETVDFWKQKAREQEKRAKDNAAAAKRLAEIEDAQKTDAQKAADRIAAAEAEVASVPSKVAEALKSHLVQLHGINEEDAELFLTADDPELLLKQVTRLLDRSDKRRVKHIVAREGENPSATGGDMREFARHVFGNQ